MNEVNDDIFPVLSTGDFTAKFVTPSSTHSAPHSSLTLFLSFKSFAKFSQNYSLYPFSSHGFLLAALNLCETRWGKFKTKILSAVMEFWH